MQDEVYNGYTYAQTSKGFYQPLGDLYFKADVTVFTGREPMAGNVNMFMVMFFNDKNPRKNDS
jgi:hypothetical protein